MSAPVTRYWALHLAWIAAQQLMYEVSERQHAEFNQIEHAELAIIDDILAIEAAS